MRALTPCNKCGKMEKEKRGVRIFLRCSVFNEEFKNVTEYRMSDPPEGCPRTEEHKGWFTPKKGQDLI